MENNMRISKPIIEHQFSNLDSWLDDKLVLAFLCLLANRSDRKILVVDSLATSEEVCTGTSFNVRHATFNYEANVRPDLVLMPLMFENHWALLVYDSSVGMFLADSIARPGRLSPTRIEHIMNVLTEITDGNLASINLQALTRGQCSQQGDTNSCGYYLCLYAESYILNRTFILEPIDKQLEKRRILWHINQLYATDQVDYRPRSI
jgi:hypothetical protein